MVKVIVRRLIKQLPWDKGWGEVQRRVTVEDRADVKQGHYKQEQNGTKAEGENQ